MTGKIKLEGRVSLVIRCFNEAKRIGQLLGSIAEQTVRDVEIVVVDSGSTDGTLEIASKFPIKAIHIAAEEFSFGRALNRGCDAASCEYLVLASAHVRPVHEYWLEHLLSAFTDDTVALTYGQQRGSVETKYSEQQIFRQWFPQSSISRQSHPFCNNANAAVRRSVWETFRYDEDLTGLEDIDWAKRVLESGLNISYVAEAPVLHIHEESRSQIRNRYFREAAAFHQIFPHEDFSLWDFFRLTAANIGSDMYHAWHDRVLNDNLVAIGEFRCAQFWGTYRGFKQKDRMDEELKQRLYYPRRLHRVGSEGRGARRLKREDKSERQK